MSERDAILAWSRRASDAEAERRGAMAAVTYLRSFGAFDTAVSANMVEAAIERGEVLPAAKKGRKRV